MKPFVLKHEHDGLWFSHAGHKAYMDGERPEVLIADPWNWKWSSAHHVATIVNGKQHRKLMAFYVLAQDESC